MPLVSELAPAHASVLFARVRVDASPSLHDVAAAHGVEVFPTFRLFRGGVPLGAASKSAAEALASGGVAEAKGGDGAAETKASPKKLIRAEVRSYDDVSHQDPRLLTKN